jgi:histidine ammonia-lyase
VSRGLRPHARIIAPLCSRDLQYNIIRSHAAGVGNPLSPARTRMLLALRINVLAKGYSGISLNTLQGLIDAFNGI